MKSFCSTSEWHRQMHCPLSLDRPLLVCLVLTVAALSDTSVIICHQSSCFSAAPPLRTTLLPIKLHLGWLREHELSHLSWYTCFNSRTRERRRQSRREREREWGEFRWSAASRCRTSRQSIFDNPFSDGNRTHKKGRRVKSFLLLLVKRSWNSLPI